MTELSASGRWSEGEWFNISLESGNVARVNDEVVQQPPRRRPWHQRILQTYASFAQKVVLPISQRSDQTDGLWEESFSCRPPTFAILLLTAAELAVFIYYVSIEGEKVPVDSPLVYNPHRRHEVWRYVSYMLIHASYGHILVNVFLQLLLGVLLETVHKYWRVTIVYICGVLAGALATSICDPTTFLVGASGGVYALITAHVASIIMNYKEMDSYPALQLVIFVLAMATDVTYAVYKRYSGHEDHTGYAAHVAGALTGLLLGVVALRNLRALSWEALVWWLCLEIFLISMGAMIIWNLALPSYFLPSR